MAEEVVDDLNDLLSSISEKEEKSSRNTENTTTIGLSKLANPSKIRGPGDPEIMKDSSDEADSSSSEERIKSVRRSPHIAVPKIESGSDSSERRRNRRSRLNRASATETEKPTVNIEQEKIEYLQKLRGLQKKKVKLSKEYNMEDSLDDMKCEYNALKTEKESQNAIKMSRQVLITCINLLEFGNKNYNPWGLHLDGWSESINENIEMYDDVFAELHEKYKSTVSMGPEAKLIMMLVTGAIAHHVSQLFCQKITQMSNADPSRGGGLAGLMNMMNQFNQPPGQTRTATEADTVTPQQQDLPPPTGIDSILQSINN